MEKLQQVQRYSEQPDTQNIDESEKEERNKRIKKEMSKLSKIFKDADVDEDKRRYLANAISNLAFMSVLLEDLQQDILDKGYIEHYKNGENQYGTKDSTAVKIYNVTLRNFNALIKTLAAFLPTAEDNNDGQDALAQFLMGKS